MDLSSVSISSVKDAIVELATSKPDIAAVVQHGLIVRVEEGVYGREFSIAVDKMESS